MTASEDGDLCLVDIAASAVVSRVRYNATAQRGLNAVAVNGDHVAAANCAVGGADHNLWLFSVSDAGFRPLDSINLTSKPLGVNDQVFDFSVQFGTLAGEERVFASTQEGLLWSTRVLDDKIVIDGNQKVADLGGSVLSFFPKTSTLLSANNSVTLFTLEASFAAAVPAQKN